MLTGANKKMEKILEKNTPSKNIELFLENVYLTFTIGNEAYGFEIEHITEIVGIQNITCVPGMPPYLKGVINLRGTFIPVIDVRMRFQMPERQYDERTSIIVVNINEQPAGFVVDDVVEAIDIQKSEIETLPDAGEDSINQFVRGIVKVGDEVKILLNVEKLLYGVKDVLTAFGA